MVCTCLCNVWQHRDRQRSNTVWKTMVFTSVFLLQSLVSLGYSAVTHKEQSKSYFQFQNYYSLQETWVLCVIYVPMGDFVRIFCNLCICVLDSYCQAVCVNAATCLTLPSLVCKCPIQKMTGRHMGD